jgi:hypothetical protein
MPTPQLRQNPLFSTRSAPIAAPSARRKTNATPAVKKTAWLLAFRSSRAFFWSIPYKFLEHCSLPVSFPAMRFPRLEQAISSPELSWKADKSRSKSNTTP